MIGREEGRRGSLPLRVRGPRIAALTAVGVTVALAGLEACAGSPGRHLHRTPVQVVYRAASLRLPRAAHSRHARSVSDPRAVDLLRHMVTPSTDYSGTQVTERNGYASRQRIEGDTRGRVRRDFAAPTSMAGDVMITGPNRFRYYHHHTNTVDVAFWPNKWDDHEKNMFTQIRSGRVQASIVGDEQIVGRDAEIVALDAGSRQMKYWIDPQTGVQLKNERSNTTGLISRSYMTSLTIGHAANVRPEDFQDGFPGAKVNALFPNDQYRTVPEARAASGFIPVEPTWLPPGYRLIGVWVFPVHEAGRQPQKSMLLRYSDGVSSVSLFERPLPPNAAPERRGPAVYHRAIQRWILPSPQGPLAVIYMGHLSPEEAKAMRDSMR